MVRLSSVGQDDNHFGLSQKRYTVPYVWSAASHGGGAPFTAQAISISCGVSETPEMLLVLLKSRWRGRWAANSPT